MRILRFRAWFGALVLSLLAVTPGQAIEAVRGKNYTLTKEHGPWMVMAASFHNVPKERHTDGLSAEEAALELVYELRERGIPAYTFSQNAIKQKIDTVDRLGRDDERVYVAQRDMVCVLAGNWDSIEDKEAQKTLASIKKYYPKFMKDKKSGAIFRETPGQKGPLGGAFLSINPLLNPQEVASRKSDSDTRKLNSGSAYPLINCKKNYTVRVATFTGKSAMQVTTTEFDRRLLNKNSYGLNRAGEDAEHLATALRSQDVEAYVHHDRYQSIVTVGSFNTPTDPLAAHIRTEYGPRYVPDPEVPAESKKQEEQKLQPHTLIIPTGKKKTDLPLVWVFDWEPQVIPVPKRR